MRLNKKNPLLNYKQDFIRLVLFLLVIFIMAVKKSELYSKLWESCDELRGGMDASQYKDYVLVLLFIKDIFTDDFAVRVPSVLAFGRLASYSFSMHCLIVSI